MSWACASRASWACPTAASRPPRRRRCRWVPRGRRTRRSTRAARGPSWTGRRARSTTPSATPGGQTYNPPSMDQETLADHLRRATRNFTARLPEERVFALGHALAVELARAHAEQPPRHPDGDPARTGARPGVVAARLRPVWRAAVGPVIASPVLTADLVLVPTSAGRLVFVDRRRGRVLHEVEIGPSESSPALALGVLHVGTDEGLLLGIDVSTGGERYRARLGGLVRSSPLPLQDRIVVGTVDKAGGGALVAVDAKGKAVWTRKLGAVFSSPASAGSYVLCGSDEGGLHALDAATGAVVWTAALEAKVRATPAVAGEVAI